MAEILSSFPTVVNQALYPLPSYNDGTGRLERTAWTPLTVTADLTIVGGVLALIVWEGLAESNASFSAP